MVQGLRHRVQGERRMAKGERFRAGKPGSLEAGKPGSREASIWFEHFHKIARASYPIFRNHLPIHDIHFPAYNPDSILPNFSILFHGPSSPQASQPPGLPALCLSPYAFSTNSLIASTTYSICSFVSSGYMGSDRSRPATFSATGKDPPARPIWA